MKTLIRSSVWPAFFVIARVGIVLAIALSVWTVWQGDIDLDRVTLPGIVETPSVPKWLDTLFTFAIGVVVFVVILGLISEAFTTLTPGTTAGVFKQAALVIIGCLAFAAAAAGGLAIVMSEGGPSGPVLFVLFLIVNAVLAWIGVPAWASGQASNEARAAYWGMAIGLPSAVVGTMIGMA